MSLLQREHREILAGIGVEWTMEKLALGVRIHYIERETAHIEIYSSIARFPCNSTAFFTNLSSISSVHSIFANTSLSPFTDRTVLNIANPNWDTTADGALSLTLLTRHDATIASPSGNLFGLFAKILANCRQLNSHHRRRRCELGIMDM